MYLNVKAVVVVDEDEMLKKPELLISSVNEIISDPEKTEDMSKRLHSFSRPSAAKDVAEMILGVLK